MFGDYRPHVFHAGVAQFHTVSIYELSVAVAIGKMFFNEVKELFADVSSNIEDAFTYIGLTGDTFKSRYTAHKSSFTHEKYRTSTALSQKIWELKESNINNPWVRGRSHLEAVPPS